MSSLLKTLSKRPVTNLYILLGQSNAQGLGVISSAPSQYQGVVSNSRIWNGTSFANLQAGTNNEGNSATEFGPELSLCETLSARTGKIAYLVKNAVGSTSLAVDWLAPSGANLTAAKTEIDAAITHLNSNGHRVRIAGIFWIQGEQDASNSTHAAAYKTNLLNLISNLRTAYAAYGSASCPFVTALLNTNQTYTWVRHVVFEQRKAVADSSNLFFVRTFDLGIASNHYNATGQVELGKRLANACIEKISHNTAAKLADSLKTNLEFHVDSDDITTLSANYEAGGSVRISQCNSLVGSLIGVQATDANRPLWLPNYWGNRDCLNFNGVTRYLTFGDVLNSVFSGSGKKFSIIAATRSTTGAIFGKSSSLSENHRSWYVRILSNKPEFVWLSLDGTSSRGVRGASNADNKKIITMFYDGSVATGNGLDRVQMFLNGASDTVSLPTAVGSLFDIPSPTAQLTLGATASSSGSTANNFFNGEIAEILVYSRIISTTERQQIESHLNSKWAVY
jgi:hypothetical protein